MPDGWIILDKPLAGSVMKGAIFIALTLTGCGLLPRTSTSNEVLDAVLIREDPFGDCVTVDGQTVIFEDIAGPNEPPGQLTPESFQDPGARAAAAAIAVSYRDHIWRRDKQTHFGARNAQDCTMDLAMPSYSVNFAFIHYSSPGGAVGVYVFRKDGTRWVAIEDKVLGAW
ncbi:MAG: hypothetical protein WBL74_04290 [Novosphingobium sp.]|uniref:hypothetical protein n=1 Tax=Novosphingobium sp. TaxID=1874826 RepID=UPI003C7CE5D7